MQAPHGAGCERAACRLQRAAGRPSEVLVCVEFEDDITRSLDPLVLIVGGIANLRPAQQGLSV